MLRIQTADYYIEYDQVVNSSMFGEETLLDADILVVEPEDIQKKWSSKLSKRNDGALVLYSSKGSDDIRNVYRSRANEIESLLSNGKIIIVFVAPLSGFMGEINDQNQYRPIWNYDFLPTAGEFLIKSLKSGKGSGENLILENPSNMFAPYFKAFKNELHYEAYLNIDFDDSDINFIVNRSNKPVGFVIKVGKGLIAFLPSPQYKSKNEKLVGVIINCCQNYLTNYEKTPSPEWLKDYKLIGEETFDGQIADLQKEVNRLQGLKEQIENEKSALTEFKALLYEQGPVLENVVIRAFRVFGFKADNRKEKDLEHDIVFNSSEGRGIAEVEGKDNDAIHVSKFDQLNRAVDEDFELNGDYAAGLLIGNHYRFTKPESRKDPFSEKVLIVAKKKNFGLLTTQEIYKAIDYILNNPNDDQFKKECRTKILTGTGHIIKLVG
jgi:hypothetical protein